MYFFFHGIVKGLNTAKRVFHVGHDSPARISREIRRETKQFETMQ